MRAAQPGGGPPAQPRHAAAVRARARRHLPGGTHHQARPQPQHHRRADRRAGHRRPGQRGGAREHRPGRTTVAGRPARVGTVYAYALQHRGGPAARRPGRPGRRASWTAGRPTGRAACGRSTRSQPLAGFVREMRRAVPADARCVGAGVAVAGMVRRDDGMVRLARTIGWVDEPVGEALGAELGDEPARSPCGNVADVSALVEHSPGRRGRLRQRHLPVRRRRRRRRHHRRRPPGDRPRRVRRRGRPHGGQPERARLRVRVARLLGDRDRRVRAADAAGRPRRATGREAVLGVVDAGDARRRAGPGRGPPGRRLDRLRRRQPGQHLQPRGGRSSAARCATSTWWRRPRSAAA